ncbi:MAG: guanylate kinase [Myxococcota bacterium]
MIVSAPSGGGKTTICRAAMAELEDVEFSISHTTRKPRPHEIEGRDYFFLEDSQFDQMIANDEFLEWAKVHGNRYGTARATVEQRLSDGIDILFDIDVQGGRQIADRIPDAVLVYVLPPSMEVLTQRLRTRASDAPEEIARRLDAARDEIKSATFYTHWIVNDELDEAVAALRSILIAERHKRYSRSALLASVLGESSS